MNLMCRDPQQNATAVDSTKETGPLGLKLTKSQSFLYHVESVLSHIENKRSSRTKTEACDGRDFSTQHSSEKEKLKASNFPVLLLRIGDWMKVSRYEGDLVGKIYYAKKKIVWEVLDAGRKSKIEIQWSDIIALRATFFPNEPDVLEVELENPPIYYEELDPQPRKHTMWKPTEDFTEGNAPLYRRHYLHCPEGTLSKHYEKLLKSDLHLRDLNMKPFPIKCNLYSGSSFNDATKYYHTTSCGTVINEAMIYDQTLFPCESYDYLNHHGGDVQQFLEEHLNTTGLMPSLSSIDSFSPLLFSSSIQLDQYNIYAGINMLPISNGTSNTSRDVTSQIIADYPLTWTEEEGLLFDE